jgi:hypothetical protein
MNVAHRRFVEEEQWTAFSSAGSELAPAVTKPVVVSRPQLSATTVVHNSTWARPTIDRLVALTELKNNWDQRGSAAPRGDALSFAWNVLSQILPYDGRTPVIVPLGNGGVQLEWSTPHHELEIEITRPFESSAIFVDNGTDREVDTENLDQLARIVQQYFRT